MKKPYRARFRAYRRYRSEIWGEVISKGKFTTIFRLLIKLFNLQLRIYLRKNRFFSFFRSTHFNRILSLQINSNKKKLTSFALNNNFLNTRVPLYTSNFVNFFKPAHIDSLNTTTFISTFFARTNLYFLVNYHLLNKLIDNFWFDFKNLKFPSITHNETSSFSFYKSKKFKKKKDKDSSLFDLLLMKNSSSKTNKTSSILATHPFNFARWYHIKKKNLVYKKYFASPFFWVQKFNKLLKKWRYLKNSGKFKQKYIPRRFINKRTKKDRFRKMKRYYKITRGNREVYRFKTWLSLQKRFSLSRWSKWWSLKIQQKKMALFYGVITKRKFKFINNLTFFALKLQLTAALKLESMISVFLFRLNLFTNMYNILNFIKLEGCLINNKIIVYPFRMLKIGDIITINKKYFRKILNDFYIKFKRRYVYKKRRKDPKLLNISLAFMQFPPYIFVNYKILHFKFIRYPKKKEIISPITFPFTSGGPDWAISTRSTY